MDADEKTALERLWAAAVDASTSADFRHEDGTLNEEAYLRYKENAIADVAARLPRSGTDPIAWDDYLSSVKVSPGDVVEVQANGRYLPVVFDPDLKPPLAVRRLFATGNVTPNPTLGTLVDLAAALGLRIRIEPLPDEERQAITEPLRTGHMAGADIKRLAQLRQTPPRGAARPAFQSAG